MKVLDTGIAVKANGDVIIKAKYKFQDTSRLEKLLLVTDKPILTKKNADKKH